MNTQVINRHSFISGTPANRQLAPLTMDQLKQKAPSVFAASPHGSRSDRYVYIETAEIVHQLEKRGFFPVSAIQSRSRIPGKSDFTKHMIKFIQMDLMTEALKVGDSVPQVALVNSHDGTSQYELFAALYKLICSNGLMIAGNTLTSVKIPHKGDIINDVVDGTFRVISESQLAMEASGKWNQLQLSSGEQQAFAMAAHTLRFADSEGKVTTPIRPDQLLRPRRGADAAVNPGYSRLDLPKPDLWTTFNVVQENVIKGGLHGIKTAPDQNGRIVSRKVSTREVKGIDQDVRLNRALWTLADELAKIKAA